MHQAVQIREPARQHPSRLDADLPDAKAAEQPRKAAPLALRDRGDQVLRTLFPHALQRGDGLRLQLIEVGDGFHQSRVDKGFHHRSAKSVDVHRLARGKVGDVAQALRGTFRAGAAHGHPVLVPHHRAAALRADLRQMERLRVRRTAGLIHLHDLRNDFPRLLHPDGIADAHVQTVDEVLVVQRRGGNGGAGKTDRLQNRLWRQNAGASHLRHDVTDDAGLFFRRILIGHRPARRFCRAAKPLPRTQVVELDHRAVHLIRIDVAVAPDPVDAFHTAAYVAINLIRHDLFKSHRAQRVQRFRVGTVLPRGKLNVVHDQIQLPLRRDLRVGLAQRPGGGIARIGQRRLSRDFAAAVELLKRIPRHIDLAPDDQALRRAFQPLRQRADGAQVFGHILAGLPVAACRAAIEYAVPVFHGDGKPVDLRLHVKFPRLWLALRHTRAKGEQLRIRKNVRQALQRRFMPHRGEFAADAAPHAARRRIRRGILREPLLQIQQRVQQPVIFKVGDGRRVLVIVMVGMLLHLRAQRKDFLLRFVRFHFNPPEKYKYPALVQAARFPRSALRIPPSSAWNPTG